MAVKFSSKNGEAVRKTRAAQARLRLFALQSLAEGLSTSNPRVEPSGFVIVVEEGRPEFLDKALASIDGTAPLMAVGVRRLPRGPLPYHVCGRGTDQELMQHVTRGIREGRLGGGSEVRLLTEPLRARWWAGVFREQARRQRAPYAAQAVGLFDTHWSEEDLLARAEDIIAESFRLLKDPSLVAAAQGFLRGLPRKQRTQEFVPGGAYYHALRQVLKA